MTTPRKYVHPRDVIKDIPRDRVAGARVTLVNMPLRETAPPNCLPNGIALLAAQLRIWGVDVSILDLNVHRIPEAGNLAGRHLSRLEAKALLALHFTKHGDPDVVALSGMITTLKWQEDVARIVRQLHPDVFLVSGNGLATEFKEGLFNWIPELDAVGHSEGDYSVVKIVHDAMAIKRFGFTGAQEMGLLNPYYFGEIAGRHRFVYDGGRPDELDLIPFPAYDLLVKDAAGFPALETYLKNQIWGLEANNSSATPFTMNRSINTISSRGCPFACKFCFRGATGERNYTVRTAQNLAGELKHYRDAYGIDFVGILDDNFMVQRGRIEALAEIMEPFVRETGIRWGTHGRLDEAADLRPTAGGKHEFQLPLRVDWMAKAGCVYIGFGAESADKRTLEAMGKGGFILANGVEKVGDYEFPRTMMEGVRNTKRAGIHANLTWIMGYPGENLEQLKTTAAFIKWQEEFYALCGDRKSAVNRRMFLATAYPGTEMFKHPKVQQVLGARFGIQFDSTGNTECNDNLREYVSELDDATKLMVDAKGNPLYYGAMPEDQFLKAREYVEAGDLDAVLGM